MSLVVIAHLNFFFKLEFSVWPKIVSYHSVSIMKDAPCSTYFVDLTSIFYSASINELKIFQDINRVRSSF